MRGMLVAIALIAACLMFRAMPLQAGESAVQKPQTQTEMSGQKDECLLILRNCEMRAESLQQKITHLQHEIAKGTAVYSKDELDKLREKLQDANRTLDLLLNDRQTLGM